MKTWQTIVLIVLTCAGLYVALAGEFDGTWKTRQLVGLSIMLPLLLIVPVQAARLRKEAAVLEAAFGEAYRTYKRRTWF